jgi:D-alanyl-lipoteichoic acid acyltransferase DltB (MBOAT superfamily)
LLFNSFAFLAFAALFFPLYRIARHDPKRRQLLLIAASLIFYGWWDWRFVPILVLTGLIDYYAALGMADSRASAHRFLAVSIVGNLGILAILKYYGFVAESLNAVLRTVDSDARLAVLNAVPPVGVSFYTFMSMSYAIDVYRGVVGPERSFRTYLTYLSMFPHLVAGPIVRARALLPQLRVQIDTSREDFEDGLWLIAGGYFKKVVIADNIAPVVNAAFGGDLGDAGMTWWVIIVLFSAQVYCDFSGYSDIAVGLARWMGVRFPENFHHPYLATSLREFWGRWHTTLSTWFRDYVYIPLGGSRGPAIRVVFALFVTMLLSGLWHGAAWHFVLWGLIHAVLLGLERRFGLAKAASVPTIARLVGLNAVILITWVFFRASSVGQTFFILGEMFSGRADWSALSLVTLAAWAALAALLLGEAWVFGRGETLSRRSAFAPVRLAAILVACIYLRGPGSAFIYFQF